MKTYVFDASALFAFLQNGPGAPKVNHLLKEATRKRAAILMSAVNYGEVYGLIVRAYGPDHARSIISAVHPLAISFVEINSQRAVQAAETKVRHKLYFVDSFAAALAIEHTATLVTSDSDFRKLGHTFPILWLKA